MVIFNNLKENQQQQQQKKTTENRGEEKKTLSSLISKKTNKHTCYVANNWFFININGGSFLYESFSQCKMCGCWLWCCLEMTCDLPNKNNTHELPPYIDTSDSNAYALIKCVFSQFQTKK